MELTISLDKEQLHLARKKQLKNDFHTTSKFKNWRIKKAQAKKSIGVF